MNRTSADQWSCEGDSGWLRLWSVGLWRDLPKKLVYPLTYCSRHVVRAFVCGSKLSELTVAAMRSEAGKEVKKICKLEKTASYNIRQL